MRKILIAFFILIILLLTFYLFLLKNEQPNDIYLPSNIKIKKEISKWGKTTYLMTSYNIIPKIDYIKLKNYPIYYEDNSSKLIIKWKPFAQTNKNEQEEIKKFLKYEKFDSITNNISFLTFVYEKKKTQIGKPYFDFSIIGVIDTINNKFYLIEWKR